MTITVGSGRVVSGVTVSSVGLNVVCGGSIADLLAAAPPAPRSWPTIHNGTIEAFSNTTISGGVISDARRRRAGAERRLQVTFTNASVGALQQAVRVV